MPQSDDMLTQAELKWLMDNGQFKTAEDVQKLSPPEMAMFNQLTRSKFEGHDPSFTRQDSAIASGVPFLGSVAPEDALMLGMVGKQSAGAVGKGLKGFAESPDGFWQGIKGAMKAFIPKELEGAAVGGAGEATSRFSSHTPAISDAEFELAQGRPRGSSFNLRKPGSNGAGPANFEHVPKATSEEGGAMGRSLNGGVQRGNLDRSRNVSDIREQVTGSSRNGWEDGRSQSADYNPSETNAELEAKIKEALDGGRPKVKRRNPR